MPAFARMERRRITRCAGFLLGALAIAALPAPTWRVMAGELPSERPVQFPAITNQSEKFTPYADAEDDQATYLATGAPLTLRAPAGAAILQGREPRLPLLAFAPLPPRRPPHLTTAPETPGQEPPPPPPVPPVFQPEIFSDRPVFLIPQQQASLTMPSVPQASTKEEIEEEEAKTPEPMLVEKQTDVVNIACLQPELLAIIRRAGEHFKGVPVVTSGARERGRKGSYHRKCMAADFFIAGVERARLARYLRDQGDAGGVGTYCHTKSVHIDTGEPRNWWQCGFRFRFAQR